MSDDKPRWCQYGQCCTDPVTTQVSGKLGIKGGWFCTYHAGLTNGRILERSGGTTCCKPGSYRAKGRPA